LDERTRPGNRTEPIILDGDFKITRRLALGGDSEVFLAEQLSVFNRRSAVKVYRESAKQDRRDSPFNRERRLLSLVTEDVFPVVYRTGLAAERRPYIAMEYIQGRSLGQFMERGDEAFSVAVALRILDRLAEGLHDLHVNGIVHRDLKPDNIILMPKWQGHLRVKLIDFSHAKVPFGLETRGVESDPGFIGTPFYMAPEQASGKATDARADVFSLAVVFYEILTSVRAIQPKKYSMTDFFEYLNRRHEIPSHPIGTFRPELPEALDEVIRRACSYDVEERPASVQEFHAAAHQVLGARAEADSRVASPGRKAGRWTRWLKRR
jgi:serine/threonine-protein kinase